MAQLTCQNLCVGYDGRPVLQDLTFELLAGDYLCTFFLALITKSQAYVAPAIIGTSAIPTYPSSVKSSRIAAYINAGPKRILETAAAPHIGTATGVTFMSTIFMQ